MVCVRQCPGKIGKQRLCPRVGVGLEDAPDLTMRVMSCCREACGDLCRVMGVVVNDGKAIYLSLIFKTPVRAGKFLKPFLCCFGGNMKLVAGSQGGKGIGYIVVAADRQGDVLLLYSVL